MRKNLVLFGLFVALSASAQDIVIDKNDGSTVSHLSMMELHGMSHFTDEEGNESVKIELRNGTIYKCKADDVKEMNIRTKDDLLKQPKYANTKFLKTFNSVQDLEEGEIIGIFSEADYDYNGFVSTAYSVFDGNTDSPIVSNVSPELIGPLGAVVKGFFRTNLGVTAWANGLSANNIRIHVADIIYVGNDIDGTKVPLTARIQYPYSTLGNKAVNIKKFFVEQHTTLFEDDQEPSYNFYPFSCSSRVLMGEMVIQPDLLGFGITSPRTQLFVAQDVNGRACADCLKAAVEYVEYSRNSSDYPTAVVDPEATVISAGSSQGATTALAFTKYMENELPGYLAESLPKVSSTHLCAGAFNLQASFEKFVECDSIAGFVVPVMVSTATVQHPEYMRDSNGNFMFPYDILSSRLKTLTWPGFEDLNIPPDMTYWDMLNFMKGNSTGLSRVLAKSFPYEPNPTFTSFRKLVSQDALIQNPDGSYSLNYNDERIVALMRYFADNNLTDPSEWVPNSNIDLLHSTNDATVPFVNSELLYNNMRGLMESKGLAFSLNAYENPKMMNHVMICLVWMLSESTGMPVSTILALMENV